jgi:hypothetical protein
MAKDEAKKEEVKKEEVKKSRRKLTKEVYDGGVKITVLGGEKGEMDFPFAAYPVDVQTKFGPFGQGHKLGDAAAGRSGADAEEAIVKVNAGLLNGDWSTRAPAVPKVKVSDIIANFANLSEEEKATAAPLLAALGIDLPA